MRCLANLCRLSIVWLLLCLSTAEATTLDWLPRIDPSGRHIFLPRGEYPYDPKPGGVTRHTESGVQILPTRVIAPVGAEVVLTAGVCGRDGYLTAFERVEWSLAPGGVGYFVDVGRNGAIDHLRTTTRAQKVDNSFAIGVTARENTLLTRGTPTKGDDVPILRGQSWVTVSSPVEGTSYITAYAPNAYTWDKRKDTNTIYWIDANWELPMSVSKPAGSEHTLTTTVHRATTHLPLANWRVRYEIVGGPPAAFLPSNTPVTEVVTNSLGQAPVQIHQTAPGAGANDIRVQVIRPAELTPDGLRLNVVEHMTKVTWGPTSLIVDKMGPAQAATGQVFSYRIDVRNGGQQTVKGVVLTDQLDAGLTLISTNPPTTQTGNVVQWSLQDMVAGEARAVELIVRADRPGPITNCAVARSIDGVAVQDCVTTTVTAPELRLEMSGPDQTLVGQHVVFTINVTNVSGTPATGLILVDRFDAGFRHPVATSPIERELEDLQPGQTRTISVDFDVIAPGQLCNVAEIQGRDGTVRATTRKCLNAVASANPIPSAPGVPPAVDPNLQAQPQNPPAQAPAQQQVDGPKPQLFITKTGPNRKMVGERADFTIDVTNRGSVAATNVKITDNYDQALDPVQATDGHAFAGDDLVWMVDQVPPGRTIRFQVNCQCNRRSPRACNRATVTCAEGVRADGEWCVEIVGPSSPLTVTVTDSRDPVSVGNDCLYDIRVKNNNSEPDRQVSVTVNVPENFAPQETGNQGPGVTASVAGSTIRFAPVNELRAGEQITFRVNLRAIQAGAAVVKCEVTSAASRTPTTGEASTTVVSR